ncbi:hypothetical protein K466DRAFT_570280 [Polyporus arcularius HHB13444]|uniref:Uncharacterized protein n=1 Tax=Polyporus arcularius HHB13444 TaxID=1314778 RepID=A0A5C3NRI1_9APHY|nr:hypothetical protein K466DRAFT_570280 [Polyporus arcularius HHB13444]
MQELQQLYSAYHAGYLPLAHGDWLLLQSMNGDGHPEDDSLQLWVLRSHTIPRESPNAWHNVKKHVGGPCRDRMPQKAALVNGVWAGGVKWEHSHNAVHSYQMSRNLAGPSLGAKIQMDEEQKPHPPQGDDGSRCTSRHAGSGDWQRGYGPCHEEPMSQIFPQWDMKFNVSLTQPADAVALSNFKKDLGTFGGKHKDEHNLSGGVTTMITFSDLYHSDHPGYFIVGDFGVTIRQNGLIVRWFCEKKLKVWMVPVYTFYKPKIAIVRQGKRVGFQFDYAKPGCKHSCTRWTKTKNKTSMQKLRHHVKSCWGAEILTEAQRLGNLKAAHTGVEAFRHTGTIMNFFDCKAKGKVTYSIRNHTAMEARSFVMLMKTGWRQYQLPSPSTVSRDVQQVFLRCCKRIMKMHQVCITIAKAALQSMTYETSQNFLDIAKSKALIVFAVHLHHDGKLLSFLLDVIEVVEAHIGKTMVCKFHKMVELFKIAKKILVVTTNIAAVNDTMVDAAEALESF